VSATNHKALEWDDRYAREQDETAGLESYTLVIRDLLLQSKQIVRDLAIHDGKILDIAGGTGKHLKFFDLEGQGNRLFLVDFSNEAVSAAKLKGIHAERCDLERERIPHDDESFDLVLAQEIVEHLPDCTHLLREAYRVLKYGGYLYLTTPNLAGLIDRYFLLRGKKPLATAWDKTHIRLYLFEELEELFQKCGFEIVRSTTQGAYLCFRNHFFRLLWLAQLNRSWGQHIMILARKGTDLLRDGSAS
jgi:ubiquinone/menaquinone biosynthesis C-methylase UbiE